jgi:pyruvate formate lyase activating enzyme
LCYTPITENQQEIDYGYSKMELNINFNSFPAKYWHQIDNDQVQCDLCPRGCKLRNNQSGVCFLRACKDNRMVTTYGKSSGFCIDPIEKKPLFHFYPGTSVLSFGTAGCNLTCKFCQNWNISKSKETTSLPEQAAPQLIAGAAHQFQCPSVAFTYNEPVIFMEYAMDTAKECRNLGIKTVAVTAGYIAEKPRVEFFQHIDAANVDLKAFNEDFYRKLTGAHLGAILDTLKYIKHETKVWLEITTLLIPGYNDSPQEIDQLSQWIRENLGEDVPLHFSAFHPAWKMTDTPPTPIATLLLAREIAKKNNLRYVYIGNVHDADGSTTFCHGCGKALIIRDWHRIASYHLDKNGCCPYCKTLCSGIFQQQCGTWNAKCLPIRLSRE